MRQDDSGVTEEFPADVGQVLQPGSTAVVAELWEQRTSSVDTWMRAEQALARA